MSAGLKDWPRQTAQDLSLICPSSWPSMSLAKIGINPAKKLNSKQKKVTGQREINPRQLDMLLPDFRWVSSFWGQLMTEVGQARAQASLPSAFPSGHAPQHPWPCTAPHQFPNRNLVQNLRRFDPGAPKIPFGVVALWDGQSRKLVFT